MARGTALTYTPCKQTQLRLYNHDFAVLAPLERQRSAIIVDISTRVLVCRAADHTEARIH